MWNQIWPGLRIKLFLTLLLGVAYPLAVTGVCQALFPHRANGSLVTVGGKVVGAERIAQGFTRPEYFQPRPSAAGDGYDAANSGASNYGPLNPKLAERVEASVRKFRQENPDYTGPIPADLVTASASGLDPDLSPASARAQAARVAKARGAPLEKIEALVDEHIEGPDLGILGEARVNVLALNLALDREYPRR